MHGAWHQLSIQFCLLKRFLDFFIPKIRLYFQKPKGRFLTKTGSKQKINNAGYLRLTERSSQLHMTHIICFGTSQAA